LKLYVYGYLNRIASSRRLEREASRNVELMWLTGRLAPDHKTIADFRRDNGKAIRQACSRFVLLCRRMGLFGDAVVAIDGSKFKAVNNRDQNFTSAKMQRRLAEIEAAIARYMAEMDGADAEPGGEERVEHLEQKLASLHAYIAELKIVDEQLRASADGQVSLTDPDARSMNARGSGIVGYNVQAAVEARHHLVVAHDVVMTGSDRAQLSQHEQGSSRGDRRELARGGRGPRLLQRTGGAGLREGRHHSPCAEDDHVERGGRRALRQGRLRLRALERQLPLSSRRGAHASLYVRREWHAHRHLLGERLWNLSLRTGCTTGKERRVRRWEHEHVLDAMEERLARRPELMQVRRSTVEHVFGTIKSWMGATHFLTRGLNNVRTEISLQVLAYNLKRVMTIVGIAR
jgi:hypothetical protein